MIHRSRLVDSLTATGAIQTPWIRDAFEAVPREIFVPRYYQREDGHTILVDGADPNQYDQWLSGVYSDQALTVHVTSAPDIIDPAGAPTSSSSMPTVMAGMLEALDLQTHHRVLEIGTGTGYNAALLCHRVGSPNVVSVELHPDLANAACDALATIGLHPTIIVGDGAVATDSSLDGSFDRIIATASVDRIPPVWIDLLAPGGAIVADLRGSLEGGLVRLAATDDDAVSGRFLNLPGAFMPMRTRIDSPHRDGEDWSRPLDKINPHRRLTTTDPNVFASTRSLRFLTQMHLAGHRLRGFLPDPDAPELSGSAIDGSWFTIDLDPTAAGQYHVQQGGSHRIWDTVECAYATWHQLGQPDITRFGVTALDHNALQHVWIDHPDSRTRWPLPL